MRQSYGGPARPSQRPTYGAQGGAKKPKSITIPLPDIGLPDFGQILQEKQNILGSVVNIKKLLLSPILGIGQKVIDTKLNLIRPVLQPVLDIKKSGLGFLRGLIDQKIGLLDSFSSFGGGGGGGYGAPSPGYGAPSGGYGAPRRGRSWGRR